MFLQNTQKRFYVVKSGFMWLKLINSGCRWLKVVI